MFSSHRGNRVSSRDNARVFPVFSLETLAVVNKQTTLSSFVFQQNFELKEVFLAFPNSTAKPSENY
jgi:hypothetical protein